jgi:hypothetical protein
VPTQERRAILYAWTQANDWHFLYDHEGNVYSTDHGNFLPGGPHWTARDLLDVEPSTSIDKICDGAKLTDEELAKASAPLRLIREEDLAGIVGSAPDDWGVTLDERLALAGYLRIRQLQITSIYRA